MAAPGKAAPVAAAHAAQSFPRQLVAPAPSGRLAEVIPHARQYPIDDALTFSPLDQPQAVADAILLAVDQVVAPPHGR